MAAMIRGKIEADREISPSVVVVGANSPFHRDSEGHWVSNETNVRAHEQDLGSIFRPRAQSSSRGNTGSSTE